MKFVKGLIIGTVVSAGVAMMYTDTMGSRKKLIRKGRQMAKKIGIM
ncbi:MAG: hypothetical protein LBL91_00185 [Lachnospiraceae bacterium]|nr:hypothetical protein [Lachnospiraceae bacterium]